jgi:hypothetical protein
MPAVGDFLGDLTDELPGAHITEFVSGGPKVGRRLMDSAIDKIHV